MLGGVCPTLLSLVQSLSYRPWVGWLMDLALVVLGGGLSFCAHALISLVRSLISSRLRRIASTSSASAFLACL